MGALPESQVKAFIERLVGPVGPAETDLLLGDAEAALADGDTAGASQPFAQVYELDPENAKAIAGLARAAVAAGELEQAKATLGLTPKDKENDPAIAGARAALDLAEQAASVGDLAGLLATVEREPMNHQARYDLALGLAGAGRRSEAVDHLLEIVRRDRKWNDDGARKQLVQFFEAWGPMDESTIGGRRQLSSILFS
jgi:putative thioredoxin